MRRACPHSPATYKSKGDGRPLPTRALHPRSLLLSSNLFLYSVATAFACMSTRPLFNDWYAPDHNLGYLDGLGTWCGRIGIPVIKFELNKIYCDEGGRSIQKWEAIPKFPRVYGHPFLLDDRERCTGCGVTNLQAQDHSLRLIEYTQPGYDTTYVRWEFSGSNGYRYARPYEYVGPKALNEPEVIGRGLTKQEAKEDSSRKLLCLGRYCAYTHPR